MTFRVHFSDGFKIDVEADDASKAQALAKARHPKGTGRVIKVKVVREAAGVPVGERSEAFGRGGQ